MTEIIKLLPPHARQELSDFAEFLAQKYLKTSKKNKYKKAVSDFAGAWRDMDETEYRQLIEETYKRRDNSSSIRQEI